MSKNNYDVGDSLWYFYVDREKRLPYQIDKSGIGVIVCRDYSTAKMAVDIARTLPNWRAVIDISADVLGWRFFDEIKYSISPKPRGVSDYYKKLFGDGYRPRFRIHCDLVELPRKRDFIKSMFDALKERGCEVEVYNSSNGEPITI